MARPLHALTVAASAIFVACQVAAVGASGAVEDTVSLLQRDMSKEAAGQPFFRTVPSMQNMYPQNRYPRPPGFARRLGPRPAGMPRAYNMLGPQSAPDAQYMPDEQSMQDAQNMPDAQIMPGAQNMLGSDELGVVDAPSATPTTPDHWVLIPKTLVANGTAPDADPAAAIFTASPTAADKHALESVARDTTPCHDPYCYGRQNAARYLANVKLNREEQWSLLQEYQHEAEAMLQEVERWRNTAYRFEVEKQQVLDGLEQLGIDKSSAAQSINKGGWFNWNHAGTVTWGRAGTMTKKSVDTEDEAARDEDDLDGWEESERAKVARESAEEAGEGDGGGYTPDGQGQEAKAPVSFLSVKSEVSPAFEAEEQPAEEMAPGQLPWPQADAGWPAGPGTGGPDMLLSPYAGQAQYVAPAAPAEAASLGGGPQSSPDMPYGPYAGQAQYFAPAAPAEAAFLGGGPQSSPAMPYGPYAGQGQYFAPAAPAEAAFLGGGQQSSPDPFAFPTPAAGANWGSMGQPYPFQPPPAQPYPLQPPRSSAPAWLGPGTPPLAQPYRLQPPVPAMGQEQLVHLHDEVEAMEKNVASNEVRIKGLQSTLTGLQAYLKDIKGKSARAQKKAETSTEYVRHLTIQKMDLQREINMLAKKVPYLEAAIPAAQAAKKRASYRLQSLQDVLQDQYDDVHEKLGPAASAGAAGANLGAHMNHMVQKSVDAGAVEIEHCKEQVAHMRVRLRKLSDEQRELEQQKDVLVAEVEEARKQAGGDAETETRAIGNAHLARSDSLRLENGNLKQKLDELQAEVQSKAESNRKARAEEEATISKLIAEKEALQAPVGGGDPDDANEAHMKSIGGVFVDKARIQRELHGKVNSYEMENIALKRKVEQRAEEASAQAKANLDALLAQRDSLNAKLETINSKPPHGSNEVRTDIGTAEEIAYSNLNRWNKHLQDQIKQASAEKANMQQDLEGLKALQHGEKQEALRDQRIPPKADGRLVQKSIEEKVENRGEKDSHGSNGFWKGAAQRLMDGVMPKPAQAQQLAAMNEKLRKDLQSHQAEIAGLMKTLAGASKSWKR